MNPFLKLCNLSLLAQDGIPSAGLGKEKNNINIQKKIKEMRLLNAANLMSREARHFKDTFFIKPGPYERNSYWGEGAETWCEHKE